MARFDQGGGKRFGGNTGGSRFGGGKSFGGRGSFGRKSFGDRGGRDDRGDREMFEATCSECQKTCQVPFRPTGEKPVFCSECFGANGGRDGGRSFGRGFDGRSDRGDRGGFDRGAGRGSDDTKRQLEMVNTKLDKLIETIETLSLRWEK